MSGPLCNSQAIAICAGLAPARGDIRDRLRRLHVGVEVLALIARIAVPVVVLGVFLRALDLARQEAAAKRRKRHQTDAQLAQHRDDVRFQIAFPQRIFALQADTG